MNAKLLVLAWLLPLFAQAESIQSLALGHSNQSDLRLTVYNDFALVRDSREMVLPAGELLLEFEEVAQTLVPSSVAVTAEGVGQLQVLEQSYRYDLLNRQSLLGTYIGRKLKYSRTVLQGDVYEKVLREGILLSTNPEIVDFGDEIEISPEGVISLPSLPDGLTLSPTLVWRLSNERTGKQDISTSYLANQIGWHADYVLVLDEKRGVLNLTSWATIRNDSGTIFEDAAIRLVAGSVGRVQPPVENYQMEKMLMSARDVGGGQTELPSKELNAYQVYDIPSRITLINHEEKQLKFVEAQRVPYKQKYLIRNNATPYPTGGDQNSRASSVIEFANDQGNRLGLALAEGVARVYLGSEDNTDFIGEARLKATPSGQDVSLEIGQAFDLVSDRVQKSLKRLGDRSVEVTYEHTIHNAKSKSVVVDVHEIMQGDWRILESSHPLERVSSTLAEARIKIAAGESETLSYRVRFN